MTNELDIIKRALLAGNRLRNCEDALAAVERLEADGGLQLQRELTEAARARWAECQQRLAEYEKLAAKKTGIQQSLPDNIEDMADKLERLEATMRCDVCAGTGTVATSKGCICGGSGRVNDAFCNLRVDLVRLEAERQSDTELLREVAAAMESFAKVWNDHSPLDMTKSFYETWNIEECGSWAKIATVYEKVSARLSTKETANG